MRQLSDLEAIMDERGILALSIRRPCEKTRGKWRAQFKTTEMQLHWNEGSGADDLISALENCLGVTFARQAANLADLLA